MRIPSVLTLFALLMAGTSGCQPESAAPVVTAPEQVATATEEGFVPLFDGKSLAGWQGRTEDYEAVDGMLVCKAGCRGNLYTERQYSDFVLRLEYRVGPGGNNGVGIRAAIGKENPASTGMEIQILDDDAPKYAKLKPEQYTGSIYSAVAAKRGYTRPPGEWNAMEIRAEGPNIRVTLNGTVIVDADMDKVGPIRIRDHWAEGLHNKSGYIALCGHKDRVEFRNMEIKELK
ncbi:MAG: DUF1080 domain-containing protein [Phycisphaerae bacterium]|nr:DUF1080 domain-containing protein [Phycisphaerae bacterium]